MQSQQSTPLPAHPSTVQSVGGGSVGGGSFVRISQEQLPILPHEVPQCTFTRQSDVLAGDTQPTIQQLRLPGLSPCVLAPALMVPGGQVVPTDTVPAPPKTSNGAAKHPFKARWGALMPSHASDCAVPGDTSE